MGTRTQRIVLKPVYAVAAGSQIEEEQEKTTC